jgi:hypothetical protein
MRAFYCRYSAHPIAQHLDYSVAALKCTRNKVENPLEKLLSTSDVAALDFECNSLSSSDLVAY